MYFDVAMTQEEAQVFFRYALSPIKTVITDVDGCLTDGGVWYDGNGGISRKFSVIDGHGVELLRKMGFEVVLISGEDDECIKERARKLDVIFHGGVKNKKKLLKELLKLTLPFERENLFWYLGDDIADVCAVELGLNFYTPKGSVLDTRFKGKYNTLESRGGEGAFREFAELVLLSNKINPYGKQYNGS